MGGAGARGQATPARGPGRGPCHSPPPLPPQPDAKQVGATPGPQNNGSGAGASTAGQEQQTRRGAGACERARVAVTARGTPVAGRARDACQTELAEARARTACDGSDCQSRNLTHWRRAYAWRRSSERDPAEWLLERLELLVCAAISGGAPEAGLAAARARQLLATQVPWPPGWSRCSRGALRDRRRRRGQFERRGARPPRRPHFHPRCSL